MTTCAMSDGSWKRPIGIPDIQRALIESLDSPVISSSHWYSRSIISVLTMPGQTQLIRIVGASSSATPLLKTITAAFEAQ